MEQNSDYDILTKDGNIAFYRSCEVTEIFLHRKKDKAIFNFYTLVVFEEKSFENRNQNYLCNPIVVNNDCSLGIKRYWLSMVEAQNAFQTLTTQNEWNVTVGQSQFLQLKPLAKQFIPAIESNRLNSVLKNNFHSGAYILEFFDEEKTNVDFLLRIESLRKLNDLCAKINMYLPIDLSTVRDRIGNFVFQFPITIIESGSQSLKTWNGVKLNFIWHRLVENPPNCLLQVEATIDKNFMGSKIEDYNRTDTQIIHIGNLDQITHIRIWRKEPSLLLHIFSGTYIREISFNAGIINHEPRLFELDGETENVTVVSHERDKRGNKRRYTNFISNNLYDKEKKELEESLAFKQYNGNDIDESINDLRKLIKRNDESGVYLWDPFLTPMDIIRTLYYSEKANVPLKAICSYTGAKKCHNNSRIVVENTTKPSIENLIEQYRNIFENPRNNNYQLNFEMRMQHSKFGWAFHDRFLIFPRFESGNPKVYSLGTSINSFGNKHHILQEVSHPQPVIDAFNDLWETLDNPECIVWKFPKK